IREEQERLQRSLEPKADRALMAYTLADVAKLPAGQRIEALDREIGLAPGMPDADAAKAIDAYLGRFLAGTRLYDLSFRLAALGKTTAELAAANDTALKLTAALYPLAESNRERTKARSGATYRLGPRYADALLARSGGLVAPDANSTLRVTYGEVKGVEARDGLLYLPQTTLKGITEKATGTGEFNAPKALLDAIRALRAGKKSPYVDPKLGDVPVDFLSTTDTTGGNSGSATLNARGELVGLLFDGTYDTEASDYVFDPVKTRSIHVDTRNMLWVMTEVDRASHLLSEMGIEGHALGAKAPGL
ncbi:MAG TPA: S46 family peptidase, partial [Thermoanaerobaculia bacterium]|nr:S46 family peptidase [Thermoanaerobaculia bacterium]